MGKSLKICTLLNIHDTRIRFIMSFLLSLRIPDVTERLRQYSVGRTWASNIVFTIWAVFGGFILHFLLSAYLTVLLRPSYEEPVETAADLIKRDITPFYQPGSYIYRDFFAASSDPTFQELSRRLVIAKSWGEYYEMIGKVYSTGMFAVLRFQPPVKFDPKRGYFDWYRSSETIAGFNPYGGHLVNKKWPLKKVQWN